MADAIPELLQRLAGEDAAEQERVAGELGNLAYHLAHHSPAEVPQLEPAIPLLAEMLSSDSVDAQLVAARAFTHMCKASPALASAVGGSVAARGLVQLLKAAEGSYAQEVAAGALGALMLRAEGRQAVKEAGADEALVGCWHTSEHEQARNEAAEALVNVSRRDLHQLSRWQHVAVAAALRDRMGVGFSAALAPCCMRALLACWPGIRRVSLHVP